MGQYYLIANVDKEEYIVPSGMKLAEFAYKGDMTVELLIHLLGKRWKGDRVYVVGDYADEEKYDEVEENWLPTYRNIMLEEDENTLYNATCNFEKLNGEYIDYDEETFKESFKKRICYQYRYLINPNKKLYVDMENLPKGDYDLQISPLILLLAMGNDRGSGDFHRECTHGYEHIGAWVSDSQDLRIVKKVPAGYVEFRPDFIERR